MLLVDAPKVEKKILPSLLVDAPKVEKKILPS